MSCRLEKNIIIPFAQNVALFEFLSSAGLEQIYRGTTEDKMKTPIISPKILNNASVCNCVENRCLKQKLE